MLIKVIRKRDGFILEMPPHLANDKKFLEKNGLYVSSDEVKKPPIQQVVESKIEIEKQLEVETKEPVKKGRKAKK
jgi:hypothetical protein